MGRYAYGNQAQIGLWKLTRFAETLLPLLSADEKMAIATAEEALAGFGPQFTQAHLEGTKRKLGIATSADVDVATVSRIFTAMAENQVDYTLFFRRLGSAVGPGEGDQAIRSLFVDPTAGDAVLAIWRGLIAQDPRRPAERRSERPVLGAEGGPTGLPVPDVDAGNPPHAEAEPEQHQQRAAQLGRGEGLEQRLDLAGV